MFKSLVGAFVLSFVIPFTSMAQTSVTCGTDDASFWMNGLQFRSDQQFIIDTNDRLISGWLVRDQAFAGDLFRDGQSFETLLAACSGRVELHRSGHLKAVTLQGTQTITSHSLKDRLEFYESGAIYRGTFAAPSTIEGISYVGKFSLNEDGSVRSATTIASTRALLPSGRVIISGQVRTIFSQNGVLTLGQGIGGGRVVTFGRSYSNARFATSPEGAYYLEQGTLIEQSAIRLNGKDLILPADTQIHFNANHRPYLIRLPASTTSWNSIELPSHTMIAAADGRVTSITAPRPLTVEGIAFPPSYTIPFDLRGKVYRVPPP